MDVKKWVMDAFALKFYSVIQLRRVTSYPGGGHRGGVPEVHLHHTQRAVQPEGQILFAGSFIVGAFVQKSLESVIHKKRLKYTFATNIFRTNHSQY